MLRKNLLALAFSLLLLCFCTEGKSQSLEKTIKMEQAQDTVRVKFRVKGMHCQAGCANGIDAMLKEQDGILKSQTSFKDSASVIKFDPEKISEEKIISLIREWGFETKKITPKARD